MYEEAKTFVCNQSRFDEGAGQSYTIHLDDMKETSLCSNCITICYVCMCDFLNEITINTQQDKTIQDHTTNKVLFQQLQGNVA